MAQIYADTESKPADGDPGVLIRAIDHSRHFASMADVASLDA